METIVKANADRARILNLPQSVKGQFRSSRNPRATLSQVRTVLKPAFYSALLAWLPRINYQGRVAIAGQFPKDLRRLKADGLLETIIPENEIHWATEVLFPHASKINWFCQLVHRYDASLVAGNFGSSTHLLDELESQLGISLWSIETRIALLQVAHGLERQKNYVGALRDAAGGGLVSAFAYYISQRSEPTTNPTKFPFQVTEQIDKWDIPEDFKTYLSFKLADRFNSTLGDCGVILRHESTSSIVDLYTTYIRLAQKAIADGELLPSLRTGLDRLGSRILDTRIHKILFLDGKSNLSHQDFVKLELGPYDLFNEGQFDRAEEAAKNSLSLEPGGTSNWLLRAITSNDGDTEDQSLSGIGDRARRLAKLIITNPTSSEDARIEMLRLSTAFRLTTFAAQIEAFALSQSSSDVLPRKANAWMSFVSNSFLDPADICYLPPSLRTRFAQILVDKYGLRSTVILQLQKADLDVTSFGAIPPELLAGIDINTSLEMQIFRKYVAGDFASALTLSHELLNSSRIFFKRIAARALSNCLLRLDQLPDAIDFTVRRTLSGQNSLHTLPLQECAERLNKQNRKALAGKLATPILLDLFSNHISDRFDNQRGYAYEDFLLAHGLTKPSEVRRISSDLDPRQLIYYLRKICAPEIMEVSTAFEGSRQLQDERLAVCALLIELDAPNAKEYESEIREITRNKIIQLGVRHVDQSRIFVDLTAIRRWAERNLKEGFSRYQALLLAGLDAGASGFEEELRKFLAGEEVSQKFLELPKNEASDLLVELVSRLLRECFSNSEHGLDCYLSMRIRHGALSGQLRGPLEEQKVITQREGTSAAYKRNEHWIERLYYLGRNNLEVLDTRLAQFSRDYDAIVDHFANEYVQVYGAEKKQGLFKIAVQQVRLRALAAEVKSDTPFDDFVTRCFELFWQVIESNLESVRKTIDTLLKGQINGLFISLESDLQVLTGSSQAHELYTAIRAARTEAQNATNQVNDWFRLRTPESEPHFSFDQMIDIGLQCVKNIHHHFNPSINKQLAELPLFFQLTLMTDIFFVVFDNIAKHAGLERPHVDIAVSSNEDSLKIIVINEVADANKNWTATNNVERIRKKIAEGSYQHGFRSEGGTGFMKLRKIIGPSGEHRHLDFGFQPDGRFFVELEIPWMEAKR